MQTSPLLSHDKGNQIPINSCLMTTQTHPHYLRLLHLLLPHAQLSEPHTPNSIPVEPAAVPADQHWHTTRWCVISNGFFLRQDATYDSSSRNVDGFRVSKSISISSGFESLNEGSRDWMMCTTLPNLSPTRETCLHYHTVTRTHNATSIMPVKSQVL